MNTRMIMRLIVWILFLLSIPGAAATDTSRIEIKEGMAGMIGYGTLMSVPTLEQAVGHTYAGQACQVHVRDYVRGWAYRRPMNDPRGEAAATGKINTCFLLNNERIPFDGMVSLNIYPEKNGRMNCILYLLTQEDLLKVDKWEKGYRRVDVTDKIEEYEFSGGRVFIYEGLPEHADTAAADPKKYILIKEYVDQVTTACDSIGKDFRAEFDRSTRAAAYPIVSFTTIIWERSEK
jgi:hypothetical protein